MGLRRSRAWLTALLLCAAALVPAAAPASASEASATARIACAVYDTSIGEYGAYVFKLRHKPRTCVEFKGNEPSHLSENRFKSIRWHRWGSGRTTARATWYYCGMGVCFFRHAFLTASNLRETCGFPAYTFLKMRLPAARIHGQRFAAYRAHFNLPACSTVFSE